jgi:hypothetical protein
VLALLENPRRTPRVPVELAIDVHCEGELWRSFTHDFGPGGCSFVSQRPFPKDAQLRTLVQGRKVRETLAVDGRVVWSAGGKVGVAFLATGPTAQTERWFEQLLRARPELVERISHVPARLTADDVLVRCPPELWWDMDLTTNELLVLALIYGGASVGALAARTHLVPKVFARAVWGLIEKRVVEPQSPPLRN